jgi:threonine dehydrogenase-like Zn-dependent dehydrogenase
MVGLLNTAVVWTGNGTVEIEERAVKSPGPGQVLLQVKAAGICGTDFHILAGKHPEARPPLVIGHEFCGEIVAVGAGVTQTAIGKRAICDSYIGCGTCRFCLNGKKQLCEKRTWELGVNEDGGWQKYIVVPYTNFFELPEKVSYREAGAGCLLTCPPAAIETLDVAPGDSVLIIGDGPSSLVMLQLARLKGAGRVIVSGHREKRLALALELGCDSILNSHKADLLEWLKDTGNSPNIVIDAVGTSESFAIALKAAAREGKVHLFGLPESALNGIPIDEILWKELTITSSTGRPDYWPVALDFISRGLLKVGPLVSHAFPIGDAPEAIEFIQHNPKEIVKAVFIMDDID